MMSPAKIATSNANRYARYGLPLQQQTLRALEKRGIYCQPSVSIEHQHLAQRYVLRGVESGGAVADMGRYCAYLDADGNPALWLQQIDSISGNGRHAIVIAPELVRIEMLRVGHTYELAITLGPEGAPAFEREKCVHCGACLWNCPHSPDGERSNIEFQAGAGGLHSGEN